MNFAAKWSQRQATCAGKQRRTPARSIRKIHTIHGPINSANIANIVHRVSSSTITAVRAIAPHLIDCAAGLHELTGLAPSMGDPATVAAIRKVVENLPRIGGGTCGPEALRDFFEVYANYMFVEHLGPLTDDSERAKWFARLCAARGVCFELKAIKDDNVENDIDLAVSDFKQYLSDHR